MSFPSRTVFWPSMRERPFFDRIETMMIQREPDVEPGSLYVSIPNPDYKPAKYLEHEALLAQWEGSNLPIAQRGKKPIAPEPPYKPMSDVEFKKVLIDYGVTKNPVTEYDFSDSKIASDVNSSGSGKKSGFVGSAGVSSAIHAKTTSSATDRSKRLISFYGTDDYTKLKIDARKALKIDNPATLISMPDRKSNFKQFVKENFVDGSASSIGVWPSKMEATVAYKHIETYALTDFGSLTIKRILQDNLSRVQFDGMGDPNPEKDRFEVQHVVRSPSGGFNKIMFPLNFPNGKPFSGGELKKPIAIVHHEFGHTRFFSGQAGIVDILLAHERKAVIENSNPVRILNDDEPRYTYTRKKLDAEKSETINILTGEVKSHVRGTGWTIKKDDAGVLLPIGSPGAYYK